MKKQNIIDSIIDFLASDSAGDSKGIYHPEIVKQHLNNVFNQAVYNTWLNGSKFSDFAQLDAWSKPYVCTVVGQVGTKAHTLLPFAPMQLPNGLGVQAVYDHADSAVLFAPVESDAQVIFAELEVDDMDNVPTYTLQQNNLSTGEGEPSHMLLLDKLPVLPLTLITELDVMMIVSLEQVGDFDEIAMPNGAEDSMIQQVIALMSKKPIPDTSNDMVIDKKG